MLYRSLRILSASSVYWFKQSISSFHEALEANHLNLELLKNVQWKRRSACEFNFEKIYSSLQAFDFSSFYPNYSKCGCFETLELPVNLFHFPLEHIQWTIKSYISLLLHRINRSLLRLSFWFNKASLHLPLLQSTKDSSLLLLEQKSIPILLCLATH